MTNNMTFSIAGLLLVLFGLVAAQPLNAQPPSGGAANVRVVYYDEKGEEVPASSEYDRYYEIYATSTRDSVYVKKYDKDTGLYSEGGYLHYKDKKKQLKQGLHTTYFDDSLAVKTPRVLRYYDAEGKLHELRSFYKSGVPKRVEYYDAAGKVTQSTCLNEDGTERAYTPFERMPRYPGCEDEATEEARKACAQSAMLRFVYQNIKYPAIARENGVEGTVVVTFIVEPDGSISNVKVVRDIGADCGEESARVVRLMPPFIPGMQDDEFVRVQFNLPTKFKLEGRTPKKRRKRD